MLCPQTDNAKVYLTTSGLRRRLTGLSAASEVDNPYFNVIKNKINAKTNRVMVNVGLLATPFSLGGLKTNLRTDTYTNQNLINRDPQSAAGATFNGYLDLPGLFTRDRHAQPVLTANSH